MNYGQLKADLSMNKQFVFIAQLVLIISLLGCQQEKPEKDKSKAEIEKEQQIAEDNPVVTDVTEVQAAFKATEKAKLDGLLKTKSFTYDCNGEQSGIVTYYFRGSDLKLIEHKWAEYSHFEATDQYYVQDNKPFFIFYDHLTWTFDGESGVQDATKDDITESRYYMIGNELVQCLEKEFTVRSAATNNPSSSRVANKRVDCPNGKELMNSFNRLLEHQNQTTPMECL